MAIESNPAVLFAGAAVMAGLTVRKSGHMLNLSKWTRNKYASAEASKFVCLTTITSMRSPEDLLAEVEAAVLSELAEAIRHKTEVAVDLRKFR